MMNYSYNVRRVAQHSIEDDWPTTFLIANQGAEYWGERACGIACLSMLLEYHGLPVPSMMDLLSIGVDSGAYCERGWIHQGLVNVGAKFGLKGKLHTVENAEQLTDVLLHRGPSIVSVTHKLPIDGRKGGHLIVVSAVDVLNQTGVTFRDPSGWGANESNVALERFFSSFSGRVISFGIS